MYARRPLRSAFAWPGALTATAVMAAVAARRAAGPDGRHRALEAARSWARCCLRLAGVSLSVEGRDAISDDGRFVIMANHESSLDIPALLAALPASLQPCFLAKRSLFGQPFLGRAMRSLGFVPVDRDDRSTAAGTLADAAREAEHGGSPVVFPEETWTPDGRLLPFARGGFLLALRTGLPILPVGLEGPRLVLPPGRRTLRPGPVTVRFGTPVATADTPVSKRAELVAAIRAAVDQLRGPGGHLSPSPANATT